MAKWIEKSITVFSIFLTCVVAALWGARRGLLMRVFFETCSTHSSEQHTQIMVIMDLTGLTVKLRSLRLFCQGHAESSKSSASFRDVWASF